MQKCYLIFTYTSKCYQQKNFWLDFILNDQMTFIPLYICIINNNILYNINLLSVNDVYINKRTMYLIKKVELVLQIEPMKSNITWLLTQLSLGNIPVHECNYCNSEFERKILRRIPGPSTWKCKLEKRIMRQNIKVTPNF